MTTKINSQMISNVINHNFVKRSTSDLNVSMNITQSNQLLLLSLKKFGVISKLIHLLSILLKETTLI